MRYFRSDLAYSVLKAMINASNVRRMSDMTKVRAGREGCNISFGSPIRMIDDLTPISDLVANIDGPILFFNVGASCVLGDTYGPLIGSLLRDANLGYDDVAIMGMMEDYIGSTVITERIDQAKVRYRDHTVIAIDAAVGSVLGRITLEEGMLVAGAGVNRSLPPIGDYAITAVTLVMDYDPKLTSETLANRLAYLADGGRVYSLARRTTDAIIDGLRRRQARLASQKATVIVRA